MRLARLAATPGPRAGAPRSKWALIMGAQKTTREISQIRYQIARFSVQVVRGPDAPSACQSDGFELTIGVADGSHLQLTDPAVSRHHCVVRVTPDGVQLEDLGSTNGTTLGGFRIQSAFLKPGATIGAGETTLRFDSMPEVLAAPVSHEDRFGAVLGRSMAMRHLFAVAERVAPTDVNVLIEGETGTGKGLLAEAIHEASPRARRPFAVVDCGAIPPALMESELFGHERGAFTGADVRRMGIFESAQGGTVFLDEIGELPLELQPKLLRVLENRVIRRVGGAEERPLDVRIIAATNRDLRREVNRGAFRPDLWYRLNTFRLTIPPLRDRREDIALLVGHFYSQMAGAAKAQAPAEMVAAMRRAEWRGNVRELASAVERALLFNRPEQWEWASASSALTSASSRFAPHMSFRAAKMRATAAWEQQYVQELIELHTGNISKAARAARMDRSHLRELIRRHNLTIPGRERDETDTGTPWPDKKP
jgi:DNA-binding NtrC family response regulator